MSVILNVLHLAFSLISCAHGVYVTRTYFAACEVMTSLKDIHLYSVSPKNPS